MDTLALTRDLDDESVQSSGVTSSSSFGTMSTSDTNAQNMDNQAIAVSSGSHENVLSQESMSQIQDSTLPPFVFRQHLKLAKTEDQALYQLLQDLQQNTCILGADGSTYECNLKDNGSKSNLLHFETENADDVAAPTKVVSNPSDLDLTKRVTLQEVISKPSVEHTGKFLLCSNSTLPLFSYSNGTFVINTIVEESDPLIVARMEILCGATDAEKVSLALKHPYLHNMEPTSVVYLQNPIFVESFVEKTFCVRASSISDVTFLPQSFQPLIAGSVNKPNTEDGDESLGEREVPGRVPSNAEAKAVSEEWKFWGNEYSVARLHSQALFAYSNAIRFQPDNMELAAARCASLINLGLHEAALRDANFIIKEDPFNTGYILRKVNCHWGLGQYEDALDYLKNLMNKLATDAPTVDMTSGDIKRKSMFIQQIVLKTDKIIQQREAPDRFGSDKYFRSSTKLFSDEPEYYKPIDVVLQNPNNPDSRKIVITNQQVKAGKLLAITKAFSVILLDDACKQFKNPSDMLTNNMIQKFLLDSPTAGTFYKINLLKQSATSLTALNVQSKAQGELFDVSKCDAKRFCKMHFYADGMGMSPGDTNLATNSSFLKAVGGVWTFPINIRHTCVGGNAVWYTCGNLLFIRAIRDIEQYEEIIMAHVDPTESFETRCEVLTAKGIQCGCPLCQFESTESEQIKAKRANLLNETQILSHLIQNNWSKEFSNHEKWRLNYILEDLGVLRSAYAKLNFPIVEPLYNYGVYLMKTNCFDEAIAAFEKAFFVVDNTVSVFLLINLSLRLAFCYMAKTKGRDKGRSKKWFSATKSYAMLSYGCLEPVKLGFKTEFEFLERKGIASLR